MTHNQEMDKKDPFKGKVRDELKAAKCSRVIIYEYSGSIQPENENSNSCLWKSSMILGSWRN